MKRIVVLTLSLLLACTYSVTHAQELDLVLRDVLEMLVEQDPSLDIEAIEEDFRDLAAAPLNINTATTSDLERLLFLSSDQIDRLLLYCYEHPMNDLAELRLVFGLHEYEIRWLQPFLVAIPPLSSDDRTLQDIFRYARHEVDLRLDVRNMQQYKGDPVYSSLRYKLDAGHKVLAGMVVKRDAGESFSAHSRYGAYVRLNNVWRFKTICLGDYRANFGLGLVMNASLPVGKSAFATNLGLRQQGLRHYSGTSSDFMRGLGATLQLGKVDITAFYSYRSPDTLQRQTAGLNLAYTHGRLRTGLTAVEYWLSDSLPIRTTYYNHHYFRGSRQFSGSAYVQYAFDKLTLMGEVAIAQNDTFGLAALLGMRYQPVQDVHLLLLGRSFSSHYDAAYASTFSETTKANDEHGVYLGADVSRLRYWRFSLYTDFFYFSGPKYTMRTFPSWGYDLFAQADYLPSERLNMFLRFRTKNKAEKQTFYLRYQLNNTFSSGFSLRSQADFSLCQAQSFTYGAVLSEQLEYRAPFPLVAQLRLEGFYVPDWNNRIYTYENDVLYAFSLPSVYGIGLRYYLNLRYRFSDHYSLYLKASDTCYFPTWVSRQHLLSSHRTDLHLMLRITY